MDNRVEWTTVANGSCDKCKPQVSQVQHNFGYKNDMDNNGMRIPNDFTPLRIGISPTEINDKVP